MSVDARDRGGDGGGTEDALNRGGGGSEDAWDRGGGNDGTVEGQSLGRRDADTARQGEQKIISVLEFFKNLWGLGNE